MEPNNTLPPAGWYPDPNDIKKQRYWNGATWTSETLDLPKPILSTLPNAEYNEDFYSEELEEGKDYIEELPTKSHNHSSANRKILFMLAGILMIVVIIIGGLSIGNFIGNIRSESIEASVPSDVSNEDVALASVVWGCTEGNTAEEFSLYTGRLWGAGFENITPYEQTREISQAITSHTNTTQSFSSATVYDSSWLPLKDLWDNASNELKINKSYGQSLSDAASNAANKYFSDITAYCNLAIEKAYQKAKTINRSLTDWVLISGSHNLAGRSPGYPKGQIYDYGNTSLDRVAEIRKLFEESDLKVTVQGRLIGFNPGQYRVDVTLSDSKYYSNALRALLSVIAKMPEGITDINLVIYVQDREDPKAILWIDKYGAKGFNDLGPNSYDDQVLSFTTYSTRSFIGP